MSFTFCLHFFVIYPAIISTASWQTLTAVTSECIAQLIDLVYTATSAQLCQCAIISHPPDHSFAL